MGLLAPIFLTGLAALSLPLLMHLVRRRPRGQQAFSTLMFLSPTPPRLTSRSRLDQIFLLLLRLGALGLLAFAFARPFLRESALLTLNDLSNRRVALLIDSSASLRQGDLWRQSLAAAEMALDDLGPRDDVALYTFDDRLDRLIDFEPEGAIPNESKQEIVRRRLKELQPGWGSTDLAGALMTVAADLERSGDVQQTLAEPQIVLISDFQKGARTTALQGYEWPERVRVIPRAVSLRGSTNAAPRLLVDDEAAPDAAPRVRISNADDSSKDLFQVSWNRGPTLEKQPGEVASSVPPGQSRVVRLPRDVSQLEADRIVLRGDDQDFDNTYFVAPPRRETVRLLTIAEEAADDMDGPLYYLALAVGEDDLRTVEIAAVTGAADLDDPSARLLTLTGPCPQPLVDAARRFVERGGVLLIAPVSREAAAIIPVFLSDVELNSAAEERSSEFLLLGQIEFSHPLFAPFANPKYSDFTKIHFWNRWPLALQEGADTQVLARFDNGQPAMVEGRIGQGRVIALASNWRPKDSQLALSSKFVPLIGGLLDQAYGSAAATPTVSIREPVPLPEAVAASGGIVHLPDGGQLRLEPGETTFTTTEQPGVYRITSGPNELRFAVNLASAESDTLAHDPQFLEQFGVRFGRDATRSQRLDAMRQERDLELESRQKVWQWIIVAALGILGLETWWGSRATRSDLVVQELAA